MVVHGMRWQESVRAPNKNTFLEEPMPAIDTKADSKIAAKSNGATAKLPHLVTELPGPKAKQLVDRDHAVVSPSYTRYSPLVAETARGAMMEDVDANSSLDFAAGISLCAPPNCHPEVVSPIQKQASELIHMS